MKILLTGVTGQVGRAIFTSLSTQAMVEVIPLDRQQLDLTRPDQIQACIAAIKPQLIIHPAAYTAVDRAEAEPALVHAINAVATQTIAEAAARVGAGMIYFSTDYVFDGSQATPYRESDLTQPMNVYGASKRAGELAIAAVGLPHLILRTSWVYDASGHNFLTTMLKLFYTRDTVKVVNDQHGTPTAAHSIAQMVLHLLSQWQLHDHQQSGIYHCVNAGETTWFGFAQAIYRHALALQTTAGWPPLILEQLLPIASEAYPTAAKRPQYSTLSTEKLQRQFGLPMDDWQLALAQVFNSMPSKPMRKD